MKIRYEQVEFDRCTYRSLFKSFRAKSHGGKMCSTDKVCKTNFEIIKDEEAIMVLMVTYLSVQVSVLNVDNSGGIFLSQVHRYLVLQHFVRSENLRRVSAIWQAQHQTVVTVVLNPHNWLISYTFNKYFANGN